MAAYKHLIEELNDLFSTLTTEQSATLSVELFYNEELQKEKLTPWSYSLFATLPEFLKLQLLQEREVSGQIGISKIETEKLISYFVEQELKKRKAAGTYGGAFAPVTHYFGYQGRCSLPSHFDCSLGSTYGFAAGALIDHGLTGMAVTATQLTGHPNAWRVGGAPLLAMVTSRPKEGYLRQHLAVQSEDVDLHSEVFQQLKSTERTWRIIDHYSNPGPIQFYDETKYSVVPTLRYKWAKNTRLVNDINALCASLQKDVMFIEHNHLLVAALSSLQSTESVINSMRQAMFHGGDIE